MANQNKCKQVAYQNQYTLHRDDTRPQTSSESDMFMPFLRKLIGWNGWIRGTCKLVTLRTAIVAVSDVREFKGLSKSTTSEHPVGITIHHHVWLFWFKGARLDTTPQSLAAYRMKSDFAAGYGKRKYSWPASDSGPWTLRIASTKPSILAPKYIV